MNPITHIHKKNPAGYTGGRYTLNSTLWDGIVSQLYILDQQRAEDAIRKFAGYVAALENRTKDLAAMAETDPEKAYWQYRRLDEMQKVLDALFFWFNEQKTLWQSILEFQTEQEEKMEDMLVTIINLDRENRRLKKDLITMRGFFDVVARGEQLYISMIIDMLQRKTA
ncbi:MAG: hypothetical protein KF852_04290 [Saprospiraceae bacterium]|nr:hypothetical protein [Saprospiraceae bacterium]